MLIEYLQKDLASRSQKNPSFSLRAYARKLCMNPATLSSLLSGKRPLTTKTAIKILEQLDLSLEEKRRLIFTTIEKKKVESRPTFVLKEDVFEAISSWEHDAILCVLRIPSFKASVFSIAKRLNISTGVALAALERLKRLGLIEKTGTSWRVVHEDLETDPSVSLKAIQKVHKQYLDKAEFAMENQPISRRDISGITMAGDSKKLSEARQRIKEFRKELCNFLENGEKNSVYRLNVQLFPLD